VDETQRIAPGDPSRNPREDRLDSWKKIASYLKRDVSTVQRWERREGLPVHRHLHDKQGSVFAFRSELDTWWESRRSRLAEAAQPAALAEPPAAVATAAAPPRVAAWLLWGLAAAGITAALAWVGLHREARWRSPLEEARFTRLADFPGFMQAAAVSRDGRWVAFLGDRDGRTDAWVSELGSGTYRNLTRDQTLELVNPSIRPLGFTPDSSLVSIWTRGSDGSKPGDVNIIAVPTGGGKAAPYLGGVAEFDWSHQGAALVYHTTAPGDPLFVRAGAAGADRRIYSGPAGVHCHFPVWSAGDDYIYFVRGVPPDDWDLWRIRPTGTQPERLTHQHSRLSYPVVLDRHTVAYLATDADGSGPWMYVLDPEDGPAHRVNSGLENFTSLAASADGRKLVATISTPRDSLWRLATARDPSVAIGAVPVKLVTNAATPRISGTTLVYTSATADTEGIWVKRGETAHEIWRSRRAHVLSAPAISDDGARIAFTTAEDGKTALNVVDLDGVHFRRITDGLALRGSVTWFADGLSVLAAVVREGEPRLTRIYLDGEPPAPFVAEYSIDPVWSPDHRFVVYSGADIGTTFPLRAAAADGRPHPIAGVMLTRGARRVAFYPGSESLVILDGEIGHKNFWLLDLASGAKHLLAQLPADEDVRDFDVSAAEIVFDRIEASSEMAVIERTAQ
jgi:Tol biopolymer transport system component